MRDDVAGLESQSPRLEKGNESAEDGDVDPYKPPQATPVARRGRWTKVALGCAIAGAAAWIIAIVLLLAIWQFLAPRERPSALTDAALERE